MEANEKPVSQIGQASRKQRIARVRDMAKKIRGACDYYSLCRFKEIERLIKAKERRHRSERDRSEFHESAAVAVDYYIVRYFSEAFNKLGIAGSSSWAWRMRRKTVDTDLLHVCTEYLLTVALVSQWGGNIAKRIDDVWREWGCDDGGSTELISMFPEADPLVDYWGDIVKRVGVSA